MSNSERSLEITWKYVHGPCDYLECSRRFLSNPAHVDRRALHAERNACNSPADNHLIAVLKAVQVSYECEEFTAVAAERLAFNTFICKFASYANRA